MIAGRRWSEAEPEIPLGELPIITAGRFHQARQNTVSRPICGVGWVEPAKPIVFGCKLMGIASAFVR